jgi:hypothetical protein
MEPIYEIMDECGNEGCPSREDSRLDRRRVQAPLTNGAVKPATSPSYALNLTMVYDQAISQFCASHLCDRVTRIAGPEALSVAGWRIDELDRPEVLPQALQATLKADVILVSLAAGTTVPVPLCVWIDVWLPRRGRRPGTLVALIGPSDSTDSPPCPAELYLRAVAARGGLDYVPMALSPCPALSALAAPNFIPEKACDADLTPLNLRLMPGLERRHRRQAV